MSSSTRKWSRNSIETRLLRILRPLGIAFFVLISVFPFYYMVLLSMREISEVIQSPGALLPKSISFDAYSHLASRVPSWDGTPLDVDATLPPEGEGPFPTIVLHHGLGGTKTSVGGTKGEPCYNDVAFARRGFAVVRPTARGFGNSCGTLASRTTGCERGFTRLMDIRYEVRDVQHLLGLLVDQGVARAGAIGTTGVSYGGGMSMMLAYLKDRVRLPDGRFAPWRSPKGTPISLAAAWPRWGWTNGRGDLHPQRARPLVAAAVRLGGEGLRRRHLGVTGSAFVRPTGGELSADVLLWKRVLDTGRVTARARAILDNPYRYHGETTLRGTPSPLLIQQGWTDALFPVPHALAAYDRLRRADPDAPVALQLGDFGHPPAANHPNDVAAVDREGVAFFEAWLLGKGAKPAPGRVSTFTITCPKSAPPGGGPFTAARYGDLAPRRLRSAPTGTVRITWAGASKALAADLAPLGKGIDPCTTHRVDRTRRVQLAIRSTGRTMIGRPVLTGRADATGAYVGLVARLWDYDPATRRQRLVTRGAFRPDAGSRTFRFPLDGNAWRFRRTRRAEPSILPAWREGSPALHRGGRSGGAQRAGTARGVPAPPGPLRVRVIRVVIAGWIASGASAAVAGILADLGEDPVEDLAPWPRAIRAGPP